jgi:glycosyltransferase involved in cell wall biosynthesis
MQSSELPLVSIVTPSFNMAAYLEEAIRSVLEQDYPNVEYIVIDGGSDDGTLEILKRYEGRLTYISEPDQGQTDAINKGFLRSRGSIFAFLCADDTYLPGAVSAGVRHLHENADYGVIYGNGYLVAEDGRIIRPYPTDECNLESLKRYCTICQPASFIRREVFESVGMMDPRIHFGLDYDFWIRVAKKHRLLRVDEYMANSRMHEGSKSLRYRRAINRANVDISIAHYGYAPFAHVYGYCCSVLDSRDGFFEPVPASVGKYAFSLLYGSWVNLRHLGRYWGECLREGVAAVERRSWP